VSPEFLLEVDGDAVHQLLERDREGLRVIAELIEALLPLGKRDTLAGGSCRLQINKIAQSHKSLRQG
jgi:hypothetical protein